MDLQPLKKGYTRKYILDFSLTFYFYEHKVKVVPSVAEWSKALESDASAGGESPVRAPVRAATLCPYA